MPAQTIEFYFDAASPYTYLAATQIDALALRCGAAVDWKPFLLGAAFQATGNRPPVSVPAKGKYLFSDLQQWSRHYGVPLKFPSLFPINSLQPQRAATAVPAARAGDFAQAVMRAYWVDNADIQQPAVLKALASGIGLDGDAMLAGMADQAVKDRLRANTDDAIRRGAFGAPTFFVGDTMFWGNDRLVLLEAHLQGKLGA